MNEIEIKMHNGISKLIEHLSELKKVNVIENKKVIIDDIKNYGIEKFNEDFSNIGNNIIYIINTNLLPFTYDQIKSYFLNLKNKYKEKKLDYNISKINDKELWENKHDMFCLYIGSKRDNAISRFKQHIGIGLESRSTYSLWLKDWWPEKIEIQITIYEFKDPIDSESLQIIEDILWNEYKPLLGKKGSNNK